MSNQESPDQVAARIASMSLPTGESGGGGGGGGTSFGGGPLGMAMGITQMAVGLNQARKAKKLPFPQYTEGMKYALQSQQMAKENMQRGLGSERIAGMNQALDTQNALAYRNIAENSPQGASYFGRVAAMDRNTGQQNIVGQDLAYRTQQQDRFTQANSALTAIQQRSIEAQRSYKIMAQQAAGATIKQGSENFIKGAEGTMQMGMQAAKFLV
jgi:hypothetical protein